MTNIILCMKVVLSKIVYTNQVIEDPYTLNPYDLYALEQLVSLKDVIDCKLTCLCMGSLEAAPLLTRCKVIGADDAILLNDVEFAGADTFATSYVLSQALKKIDYDIIICGKQAIDGETGQVPFGLARRLGCYCISNVIKICNVDLKIINLIYQKQNEKIEAACHLPVVLVYNDLTTKTNRVSLMALKRAQRENIKVWNTKDIKAESGCIGQKGSKTEVYGSSKTTYEKKEPVIIEGTLNNVVEVIDNMLKNIVD